MNAYNSAFAFLVYVKRDSYMWDPRSLLGHALTESGSKSTALKPLMWFIGIAFFSGVALFEFHAPVWAGAVAIGIAGAGALVFLGAFVLFAYKDPDLLRSESYSIQKMAIERGIVGDDTGYVSKAEDARPGLEYSRKPAMASNTIDVETAGPGDADA